MFNFLHKKNPSLTSQSCSEENDKVIIWPRHPLEAYYAFNSCPVKSYNIFGRTCCIINEKYENYVVDLNEQNEMVVWNFDELTTLKEGD